MKEIRDEEAKGMYGQELAEALLALKDLRGTLQLAHHERGSLTTREVDKEINKATKLLRKYGLQAWG